MIYNYEDFVYKSLKRHTPFMPWCVSYFNRGFLQPLKHLDSTRFPLLIVNCSVVMFDMKIEFNMGEDVLVNRRMKVRDDESEFCKSRFHKILKIIHWVAGCNSYDSSSKRRHDFAVKMYNSNNNKIISIF